MTAKQAAAAVDPVRQRTQYSCPDQPLGQMPDAVLAKLLGVGEITVLRARKRLGVNNQTVRRARIGFDIPSYRSGSHAA